MQCSYVRYVASAASLPSPTWIHTAARDVTIPLQQNWDPSVWNAESAKWKTARKTMENLHFRQNILAPSPKLSTRTWRHRPPVKYDFFSLGFASTLQHIKINVEPWGESTLLYPLEVFRSIQILRPQKKNKTLGKPEIFLWNSMDFHGIFSMDEKVPHLHQASNSPRPPRWSSRNAASAAPDKVRPKSGRRESQGLYTTEKQL